MSAVGAKATDAAGKVQDATKQGVNEVSAKAIETRDVAGDKIDSTIDQARSNALEEKQGGELAGQAGEEWNKTKAAAGDTAAKEQDSNATRYKAAKQTAGEQWDKTKAAAGDTAAKGQDSTAAGYEGAKQSAGEQWDSTKAAAGDTAAKAQDSTAAGYEGAKQNATETYQDTKDASKGVVASTQERLGQAWDAAKNQVEKLKRPA